jgi:lipid-A-disaccharide synthase
MYEVAKRFPSMQFLVATVNNLDQTLYGELKNLPNVKFIFEDTYNLLLNAQAAIVTSGTATLETGLFKVPQIVVYKINPISYWPAKFVIKVPFISLVNLIAGKEVVKEMIQKSANPDNVSNELDRILKDDVYRCNMISEYEKIISILDTGSASENAATLMVKYLHSKNSDA